jgi:hypothetical protein
MYGLACARSFVYGFFCLYNAKMHQELTNKGEKGNLVMTPRTTNTEMLNGQ